MYNFYCLIEIQSSFLNSQLFLIRFLFYFHEYVTSLLEAHPFIQHDPHLLCKYFSHLCLQLQQFKFFLCFFCFVTSSVWYLEWFPSIELLRKKKNNLQMYYTISLIDELIPNLHWAPSSHFSHILDCNI